MTTTAKYCITLALLTAAAATALAATGPAALVDCGNHIRKIDLATGETGTFYVKDSTQAIVTGNTVVVTEFQCGRDLGDKRPWGLVEVLQQPTPTRLATFETSLRPDLWNPLSLVKLGHTGLVLVLGNIPSMDRAENPTVVDVRMGAAKKVFTLDLASLGLQSATLGAFDPATESVYLLDTLSAVIARTTLQLDGSLTDTGDRIWFQTTSDAGLRAFVLYDGGTKAMLTHLFNGTIESIDLASKTTLGMLAVPEQYIDILAVTPDGGRALLSARRPGAWLVLDLASGVPVDSGVRITPSTPLDNWMYPGVQAAAFSGDLLVYANWGDNSVQALNWKTLEMTPMKWLACLGGNGTIGSPMSLDMFR